MADRRLYAAEAVSASDPLTGVRVRQVTNHPSIHHQPFYYLPAYDDAMRYLFFVSHRTGRPEIFAELRAGGGHGPHEGCLLQLTEHQGLSEWSVHPSHDGRYVYFTDHRGGWRVDVETLKSEQLVDFGDMASREPGMVGAAMGTTSLSRDDHFWAVPVNLGKVTQLLVIDTPTGFMCSAATAAATAWLSTVTPGRSSGSSTKPGDQARWRFLPPTGPMACWASMWSAAACVGCVHSMPGIP